MIVTARLSSSLEPFLPHIPLSYRAFLSVLDVHDAMPGVDVWMVRDNGPGLGPFRWYAHPFQCLFVFFVLSSELNQLEHRVPSFEFCITDETRGGYCGEGEWLDV